jgi:hypothetical protein
MDYCLVSELTARKRSSEAADNRPAFQAITAFFVTQASLSCPWNPPQIPIPSQMNPVYTFTPHFS